jgi:hypothetical protein
MTYHQQGKTELALAYEIQRNHQQDLWEMVHPHVDCSIHGLANYWNMVLECQGAWGC